MCSTRAAGLAGICEVLGLFGTGLSMANVLPSQRGAAAYAHTLPSSATASESSPKSITEMTAGPLADGRVMRSQQDVVRLLTWLLQKDAIVPVFEHYYLCIPRRLATIKGGVPAWTTSEEDESPRTPSSARGLGSESGGSSSSPNSDSTNDAVVTPIKCASNVNAAVTVPVPLQGGDDGRASDCSSMHIELELTSPRGSRTWSEKARIAQAAGLSSEELATLQLLQKPVQDENDAVGDSAAGCVHGKTRGQQRQGGPDRQVGRTDYTPAPTAEEMRVFLRWCPLLRGGCRLTELMKVTRDTIGETAADWSRASGTGDNSNNSGGGSRSSGGEMYHKQFLEHVLEKFSPCLVKIVHEAHAQPD